MKRLSAIILILVFILTIFTGCSSKSEPTPAADKTESEAVVIKLGHGQTEAHPYHLGAVRFKELVEEATDSRIQVEIYPAGTLGQERDLVEGTGIGTIDMCITTNAPLTNFSKNFSVFEFPYMFRDFDHVAAVLDGEIGKSLLDELNDIGIVGLAYFENGFRNMTSNKPINTVADLENMKIRTMESEIHIAAFNAMGANATPMSWGEVYTALSQGTIDGQENPLMAVRDGKIFEVNKYLAMTEHLYAPAELLINAELFNSLSEEDQGILLDAADKAKIYQREEARKVNADVAAMEAAGMTVNYPDKTSFTEAVQPVYEKYKAEYGDKLDEIRALSK
ncbi:MAG: TRAP transporter substrate-binding protein [Peptococcaceae bacterium]